jgi:hypothetical protein
VPATGRSAAAEPAPHLIPLWGIDYHHARHCVVDADESDRDERTEEMMGAVARLLRSR